MLDREDHSETGRERSLLSIGDAQRGAAATGSSRLARAVAEARARKEDLAEEFRRNKARRADAPVEAPESEPDSSPQAAEPVRDAAPLNSTPAVPTPQAHPQPAADVAEPAEADDGAADAEGRWQPLIDPTKVIAGVLNSKKIIAATTVAGALLGVMIALSTPKTYFSAAELLADPRDLNLVDRELMQGGISNEATLAIVDNQVRILKSGTVLSNVVRRLNLDADPEFNGTGTSGLMGRLSKIKQLFSSSDGASDPARRTALAVMKLGEVLTVERGGRTFVVLVGANTQDPEKSALIANTTSQVFLERYGQIQSNSAGRAAGELASKLDELRNSVETAERKVETFKAENDLIDAQGRLISDDEILKLNDQLGVARARTLEIKARADSMRGANAEAVLVGSLPEELASATIQDLRTQYSSLKGEADRLAVRLGPRHPQLQAIQAQLDGLREQIGGEIRRIAASSQTELKRAVELEQQLSSRLAQLKVRQGDLSGEMVTLRELERDATAKRAVYEAYLLRAKETNEQQGINSANISIISEATPPLEPSSTSRSVTALTGTILGFLAGIGIGAARGSWASLSTTLRSRRRRAGKGARRPVATMFDDNTESAAPGDLARPAADIEPNPLPETQQSVPVEPDRPLADASAPPRQEAMHRPHASDYPYAQPQPPASDYAYAAPQPYPQPPMGAPVHGPNPAFYGHPAPPPVYAAPYGYAQPGHAPAQPYQQPGPDAYWQAPHHPGMAQPQPAPPSRAYRHPQEAYPHPREAYPHPQETRQPERWDARPSSAPQPAELAEASIEEIRASLRECREAIRELAEQRLQRRYF